MLRGAGGVKCPEAPVDGYQSPSELGAV